MGKLPFLARVVPNLATWHPVRPVMENARGAKARASPHRQDEAPMRIDLHTHSTASDGLLTPDALLRAAGEAGVTTLALTDHDTTEGIALAMPVANELGIELIPGVEINTDLPGGGEAHVLGYLMRLDDAYFQATLSAQREGREARGREMVAQLQAAGLPITWEMVRRHADGAVGRPHVAAALIEIGAVQTVAEAFDHYLGHGMVGYVPRARFTPVEAIKLIRSAGGVSSLAHPLYITDLAALLPSLVDAGLAGIETYYGPYEQAAIARLLDLGKRFGLIATGGSDYHGPGIHPTPLGGNPAVPQETIAALRRLAS